MTVNLNEYLLVCVGKREFYVARRDFYLMSGFTAHVKGAEPRLFKDLPEGSMVVKLVWLPKDQANNEQQKELPDGT